MALDHLTRPQAKLLQHGLKALGLYDGTCRGLPGPKTNKAYRDYLKSLNTATGDGFAEIFARIAEGEVGKKELGNNGGPAVRKYQKATWYPVGPWPWCAAFVCWVFKNAVKNGGQTSLKFPTTPGAWDFENWARKEGANLIKPSNQEKVKRGDIVIFTFSHIGIAVGNERRGMIDTVEGNTNKAGAREGDGVYRKRRPKRKIRSIIRF